LQDGPHSFAAASHATLPDTFDVPFLELALTGKAEALVTGDKDLLSLAGSLACPILSVDQFLSTLDIDR
jgi:predicted nucleic acid-binding protein